MAHSGSRAQSGSVFGSAGTGGAQRDNRSTCHVASSPLGTATTTHGRAQQRPWRNEDQRSQTVQQDMGDALRGCCWPFSVYSAEGGVDENLTNSSDISADEWRHQYYVARASGAQVEVTTARIARA